MKEEAKEETSFVFKIDSEKNLSANLKIRIPEEKIKDYSALFDDLSKLLGHVKGLTDEDIENLESVIDRSIEKINLKDETDVKEQSDNISETGV